MSFSAARTAQMAGGIISDKFAGLDEDCWLWRFHPPLVTEAARLEAPRTSEPSN